MTVGIPDDMRRTAVVSLAGHLAFLAALTAVPLFKASSQGTVAYQVTLVSTPARSALPVPHPPSPPPTPFERERVVGAPRVADTSRVVPKTPERLPESFQEKAQKIVLPKEIVPTAPMKTAPAEPLRSLQTLNEYRRPVLPSEPIASPPSPPTSPLRDEPRPLKNASDRALQDALNKAEELLNKPVSAPVAVVPSGSSAKPTPRPSEEINTLLSRLPAPSVPQASKTLAPAASAERPPQPRAVGSLSSSTSRAATLEKCPPRALGYCPLLEAALNRAWNADTNPDVRRVLESAGDSTSTVRIVIHPNGEVQISVSRSSGNEPYDRAVLSVLRGLKAFPPLPDEMKGEPFVATTSFTYTKNRDS